MLFTLEQISVAEQQPCGYRLLFRDGDGQEHEVLATVENVNGIRFVHYEPNDPVFSMQASDDPRPVTAAVIAFDHARDPASSYRRVPSWRTAFRRTGSLRGARPPNVSAVGVVASLLLKGHDKPNDPDRSRDEEAAKQRPHPVEPVADGTGSRDRHDED